MEENTFKNLVNNEMETKYSKEAVNDLLKKMKEEWEERTIRIKEITNNNLDKGIDYFKKLFISENNLLEISNFKIANLEKNLNESLIIKKQLDEKNKKLDEENIKLEEEINNLKKEKEEIISNINKFDEGMKKIDDDLNKIRNEYLNKLNEEKVKKLQENKKLKQELNLLINTTHFRIINAEPYKGGHKIKGFLVNNDINKIKEIEIIIHENNGIERHIQFWNEIKEFLESK